MRLCKAGDDDRKQNERRKTFDDGYLVAKNMQSHHSSRGHNLEGVSCVYLMDITRLRCHGREPKFEGI